jgi:hypothetical protein
MESRLRSKPWFEPVVWFVSLVALVLGIGATFGIHAQAPPVTASPTEAAHYPVLLLTQDITQPAWVWSVQVPSCSVMAFAWNTTVKPWVQLFPVVQCDPATLTLTATFIYSQAGRLVVLVG